MKTKNLLTSLSFIVVILFSSWMSNAQTYCSPTFASGCSNWKNQSIVAGSINWTGPTACTTWDFTNTSTVVSAGGNLAMTVVNGVYCGCSVWVDFNSDGDFDDSGENLYSNYIASGTATYSFSIAIPASIPNGLYRMRVVASWGSNGTTSPNGTGACGSYSYGNYDDFTLNVGGIAPCNAPALLNASAITSSSAVLTWGAVSGATGYEYVIDNNAAAPSGSGTFLNALTYTANGLTPSTTYYLHVRTDCGTGNYSTWSNYSFTTNAPCLAPANLNAANITASSALLSWGSVSTATGYEYVLDNSPLDPTTSGTPTLATTYNASTLSPATTYYLHVRSNCGNGEFSPWATYSFSTISNCNAVSNLSANGVTSTSATISWSPVSGASGYEYVVDNTVANPSGSGTATTLTNFNTTTLNPSTLYYVHVRTSCGSTNFSTWNTLNFTTKSPNAVTNINEDAFVFECYPNPINGIAYFHCSALNAVSHLSIYDISGRQLESINITNTSTIYDMTHFPNGVYFALFEDGLHSKQVKIIKR